MSERIIPFSSGSQFADWDDKNCGTCKKGEPIKEGLRCQLRAALWRAYYGAEITEDTARRIGYIDAEGKRQERYGWRCTEHEASPEGQARYDAWVARMRAKREASNVE